MGSAGSATESNGKFFKKRGDPNPKNRNGHERLNGYLAYLS